MPEWMRRPRGDVVVATICTYELAALHRRSPLPTFSHLIETRRHGWLLGVAFLGGFGWHWWGPTVQQSIYRRG